ncbi:MAG TPA: PQQ-binding-like beta-propeller repeat protein [Tepidisphaeraceae bacterium]|nr:PQQ-binding-like beta-propeller repeat protein [Tepidisphaeraceae bacterium]
MTLSAVAMSPRASGAIPGGVAEEAAAAGVTGGLAVVVGSSDGAAESALARDGTRLVQGLARDEKSVAAAREAIARQGLYGLASVVRCDTFSRLPYADGLVDLLLIDADGAGAAGPPAAEIARVLAPGGVCLTWADGTWRRSVNPRSADLDDWTHFDHDAAGTGQSHDRRIGPPTHVQWRVEVQPYRGWGGNPAGYRPYSAFRVAGGRSFCVENQGDAEMAVTKDKAKAENLALQARVAANGLPLWRRPISGRVAGATHIEYQMIADADRVVFIPEASKVPVALDARTGKELFSYDVPQGELPGVVKGLPAAYYQLRMEQGTLLVSTGGAIHACDAATGKRRWTYAPKDVWPAFPRILPGGRVVVQLVTPADGYKVEMRWPSMPTVAVASVDLADGKEQWRVATPLLEQIPKRDDVSFGKQGREAIPTGPMKIGQTMLAGDNLFLFGASGIGASSFPGQVACVDLKERKLKWAAWTGTWGYNLVVRGDRPYWFTPSTLYTVDPADGKVSKFFDAPFNNRCNRSAATGEWLINGMGIWVDAKGEAVVRSIARSGCAQGPTLAQGMVLYTPNTCWCITQLRGHIALSAEPLRPAPEDATRVRKEGGTLDAGPALKVTPFAGPIAAEWPLQVFAGARETARVRGADGREYVGSIHEHRLECRKGEETVWSFTVGGRISQAPVLHDGTVLFGSHDGFAYCLDAATGALRWRFYAGGDERRIVSHGQVESSWPVYNVVIHNGLASFTAGLHPETGGGIYAWGLDPATGAIRWRQRLVRSEVKLGPEKGKIAPNRVLNCPLTIDPDGKLAIIGVSFAPDEEAAAIQTRIDTVSFKDAARNEGGWTLRGERPAKRN